MEVTNRSKLWEEGIKLIDFAETELNRAEEDVVTFLACNNIKRAINNFLRAYLQPHNIQTTKDDSPEKLKAHCMSIDAAFGFLDFTPLDCSYEEGADNFCLEVDHVKSCLDLANEVKDIVSYEMNL